MTIAAGFNFTGGILLGADKKQSARMKLSCIPIRAYITLPAMTITDLEPSLYVLWNIFEANQLKR